MVIRPALNSPIHGVTQPACQPAAQASTSTPVGQPQEQVAVGCGTFGLRIGTGQFVPLADDGRVLEVGRQPECAIRLDDASVSRNHASLCVRDGQFWIRDNGSSNGTHCNGHWLEPQQWYTVDGGTQVVMGDQVFTIERTATPGTRWSATQSANAQAAMAAAGAGAGSVAAPAMHVAGQVLSLVAADGRTFPLAADGRVMAVGRREESDIRLEGNVVSRSHAQVRVVDGKLQVQDVGSANGTTVNGHALASQQWYAVDDNSRIAFGGQELQVRREAPAQAAGATGAAHQAQQVGAQAQVRDLASLMAYAAAAAGVGGPAGVGLALTLDSLKDMATRTHAESKADYLGSLQAAGSQMAKTDGVADLPQGVPTLLVPDLHARRDFLVRILDAEIQGEKIFNLLQEGRINLVCLGDGMHAEGRARERWQNAVQEFLTNRQSPSLDQEMVESLGTMKMVMDLKTAFPENFHYVRGNHDDVDGKQFRKYAGMVGESVLAREWIKANLGPDFLQQYVDFERAMPLMVKGTGFVASHAAPGQALTADQVRGRTGEAFDALTWTDNTSWTPDQVHHHADLKQTLQAVGADPGSTWFVGHRPVQDGLYRSQMDGQLIQVNSPNEHVVVMVGARGEFDPDRSVVRI